MSPVLRLTTACVLLVVCCGCAGPAQPDNDFELRKAHADLERTQRTLEEEQAKVYVLQQERDETTQRLAKLLRDNRHLARDLETVRSERDNLYRLIERRAEQPLTTPDLEPSPLPSELDHQLQAFAARHTEWVSYDRATATLTFSNDRLFRPGEAEVRGAGRLLLNELAPILKTLPPTQFDIELVGHTDDQPIRDNETRQKHPTNWHLSVHRAIGVLDVLRESDLPNAQFAVKGYGSQRPASTTLAENRRVEIVIVPKPNETAQSE